MRVRLRHRFRRITCKHPEEQRVWHGGQNGDEWFCGVCLWPLRH